MHDFGNYTGGEHRGFAGVRAKAFTAERAENAEEKGEGIESFRVLAVVVGLVGDAA